LADLGAPALFEPNEGRNAEKAREILVLGDWVTPHENFLPVLDKPMPYYWLIASAYQLFGLSEFSARLPSALAALGCLWLVFRLARAHRGEWEARWAALILLTSLEFFLLARIVVSDMVLTFCVTLALGCFYDAIHADTPRARKINCFVMYLALAAGTLIKGLVGVVIPGMVFFGYFLLTKKWSMLGKLDLVPGASFYFAIVAPWYLWAEARNPGYLSYYIWNEHFGRFATDEFNRAKGWYFYFGVLPIGFLPWSLLLPWTLKNLWCKRANDATRYLILWAALPFLFFSLSTSKSPQYILPLFPSLAMLSAMAVVAALQSSRAERKWVLSLPWTLPVAIIGYFALGALWPSLLAQRLRDPVAELGSSVWLFGAITGAALVASHLLQGKGFWREPKRVYLGFSIGLGLFMVLQVRLMVEVSVDRSAKRLAERSAAWLMPDNQIIFYDTYLAGLQFYLKVDRPTWVVAHPKKKDTVAGNFYAVTGRADPESRFGKVMIEFQEFAKTWQQPPGPLVVIVKEKNLGRLEDQIGRSYDRLGQVDEYVFLKNRWTK
jgi:4-amino-4-deoxy-L-arabinose transferase-like glycosyltransferase